MAYESCGCDHEDDKEVVDEVESEDQMEYEVAEDNAPDSGAAETTADEETEAAEDMAAAEYDKAEEQVNEWANDAGQKGTDEAFEADIDFMVNAITAGLNGRKSTGQATVPVIANQANRTVSHNTTDVNESISDWKALAGIK
jgi:membrane protein involved in colicin uptake